MRAHDSTHVHHDAALYEIERQKLDSLLAGTNRPIYTARTPRGSVSNHGYFQGAISRGRSVDMKSLKDWAPLVPQLLDVALVALGAAIGANSQRPPSHFLIVAGVFVVLAIIRAVWGR